MPGAHLPSQSPREPAPVPVGGDPGSRSWPPLGSVRTVLLQHGGRHWPGLPSPRSHPQHLSARCPQCPGIQYSAGSGPGHWRRAPGWAPPGSPGPPGSPSWRSMESLFPSRVPLAGRGFREKAVRGASARRPTVHATHGSFWKLATGRHGAREAGMKLSRGPGSDPTASRDLGPRVRPAVSLGSRHPSPKYTGPLLRPRKCGMTAASAAACSHGRSRPRRPEGPLCALCVAYQPAVISSNDGTFFA